MKKKARIIDIYSQGSYHEVINLSCLMMVSELYDSVEYIADKSSCDNLRYLLKECNAHCNNVLFSEKNFKQPNRPIKGIYYLLKLIKVSLFNFYYYLHSPKNTDVFYNNNLFFAILLIQWFGWYKKNLIYDVCHNEMEWIDVHKADSKVTKYILSKYFRFAFICCELSKRFHFILLSDSMVSYFRSFIPEKNHARIFSMDHAYIRPVTAPVNVKLPMDVIKIGIPGAIAPLRGLHSLKTLLGNLHHNSIKIYAISTVSEQINDCHFVMINKSSKLMPFHTYNAYIKSMDALLLLYDIDTYKLTASGAILEAIWNEKPIIALKNNYFCYLFNKYGNMGVLCNDIDELSQVVSDSANINFETFAETIKRAKRALLPCSVVEQLKEIVDC